MDCLTTLFSHQSIRRFADDKLSDIEVLNIKKAVMQTSSACFYQVVRVIRVTDRSMLEQIGAVSGGTMQLSRAPEFWLFCLDFSILRRCAPLPEKLPFSLFFHGINDCSMACQNALTAAEAQGLGGVVIGGFKQAIRKVCRILQLPQGIAPVIGLVLGRPGEQTCGEQKPRLPMDWVIQDNGWQDNVTTEEFAAYNERFRDYCRRRTCNRKDQTWAESCAAMLAKGGSQEQQKQLLDFYREQGFDI